MAAAVQEVVNPALHPDLRLLHLRHLPQADHRERKAAEVRDHLAKTPVLGVAAVQTPVLLGKILASVEAADRLRAAPDRRVIVILVDRVPRGIEIPAEAPRVIAVLPLAAAPAEIAAVTPD